MDVGQKGGQLSKGKVRGKGNAAHAQRMPEEQDAGTPEILQVLNLPGADVVYFPSILTSGEAAELFKELGDLAEWQKRPIMIRNHDTGERFEALEGRPTVSFSLPPGREYRYSGSSRVAGAFPECVLAIKGRIEEKVRECLAASGDTSWRELIFNYCLANKYEHGMQGIGKHSDNEPDIVPHSPIACLSLGATRIFEFESKDEEARKQSIPLEHGSLILMFGRTQQRYLHSIPKQKNVRAPRISLTFRINREIMQEGKGNGTSKRNAAAGYGSEDKGKQLEMIDSNSAGTHEPPRIFTVGHSNHEPRAFFGLLARHGIKYLVDVRSIPSSGRFPHFKKRALEEQCRRNNIDYRHSPELGNKLDGIAYLLQQPEGQVALAMLATAAREAAERVAATGGSPSVSASTAYMCAEVDWRDCHRQVIADQLLRLHDVRTMHILRDGGIELHPQDYVLPAHYGMPNSSIAESDQSVNFSSCCPEREDDKKVVLCPYGARYNDASISGGVMLGGMQSDTPLVPRADGMQSDAPPVPRARRWGKKA